MKLPDPRRKVDKCASDGKLSERGWIWLISPGIEEGEKGEI